MILIMWKGRKITLMILPIVAYGFSVLREKASPIPKDYPELKKLIENMYETMYGANGIGLAATQIDIHYRVIVVDISRERASPMCLVNPTIEEKSGLVDSKEGCLSVPEMVEYVERAEHIRVKGQNENGEDISLNANGLLAICIQHEIDHLDGKLFVDYLSSLKQSRLKKRISKIDQKESIPI